MTAFLHIADPKHQELTISKCMGCGAIVAASPDRRLLQRVEEIHQCLFPGIQGDD